MSNRDWLEIGFIGLGLGIFLALVFLLAAFASRNDEAFRVTCVERGGVVLENTRVTGKVVSVSRACIRRDAIVEMEDGF
jgi:hypothetical protein